MVGGTGFIGSRVVHLLIQKGFLVSVLGREGSDFGRLDGAGARQITGDFNDPATYRHAIHGQDNIVHLMGATVPRSSMIDPVFDINSNITPTLHLLQEANKAGIKKIIFASSGGSIYGATEQTPISETHPTDPLNVYGISKLTIEKLLMLWNRVYGMSNIILRLSNVYGEGQPSEGSFGAISVFLGKILKGEQITIWGDGSVVRDYVHVDDVAIAFLNALKFELGKNDPAIFNIGSGIGMSLNDIISIMSRVANKKANVRYVEGNSIDAPINVLDINLAKRKLDYRPSIMLEVGIKRLHEYMRNQACV